MFCPHCKKEFDRKTEVCPYCGKKIMSSTRSDNISPQKPHSQTKGCIIITSLFVAVIVLFLCAFLIIKYRLSSNQNSLISSSFIAYDNVGQGLSTLEKPYLNEKGVVSLDDAKILLEEAFDYLQMLYAQGIITDCSYTDGDTAVYYQIDNWLGCIYSPPVEDMLAGISDNVHIITIEPYHSDFSMWFNSKFASLVSGLIAHAGQVLDTDGVAKKLKQFNDRFLYEQDYHDETVDLGLLYNLDFRNSILIWQGHGGYIKGKGSLLSLGVEKWSQADILIYQQEFGDGSLFLGSNGVIVVTPRFFEQHLSNYAMKNCLVYLNTCASLKDHIEDDARTSLAQAILNCGASCVIGNTDSVHIWYAYGMQDTIFDALESDSSNGSANCVTEAIQYALDLWGKSKDGAHVWAAGSDITLDSILSVSQNSDVSQNDIGSTISEPLTAAEVTWIVEPTYNYQRVIPLRGYSFSDVRGPYSDGQTALTENGFYEMSFPGYSNLPQYYLVQMVDGSWRLYFMLDHSDSGSIPMDQMEFPSSGTEMRYDATGIVNLAALERSVDHTYFYVPIPYYPSPWYLFTSNERGGGSMDIYYDTYTHQGLIIACSDGISTIPVKNTTLHKPYPAGQMDTENSNVDIGQLFSVNYDTDLLGSFYEPVRYTMQEYPKGYIDTNGQPITDFIYTVAEDFSEGVAACFRDGKWGYIDETGNEITDFVYDGVWEYQGEFDPDLGEYGAYSTEYAAYPCTSDTMVVWCDGYVGLLYRDGQTLIDFGEFEDMAPAYNNELWAKQNGLWGLIDLADVKRKIGVSSTLTVLAKTEIPDPEYNLYVQEEYPEIMPFDYPSRKSQVYEFYQDVKEFQTTTTSTSMYTSLNGDREVVVIPAREVVHVYGMSQSAPGWLCVEWNVVETQRGYIGNYYFDSDYVSENYYGWVQEKNLSPLYSN